MFPPLCYQPSHHPSNIDCWSFNHDPYYSSFNPHFDPVLDSPTFSQSQSFSSFECRPSVESIEIPNSSCCSIQAIEATLDDNHNDAFLLPSASMQNDEKPTLLPRPTTMEEALKQREEDIELSRLPAPGFTTTRFSCPPQLVKDEDEYDKTRKGQMRCPIEREGLNGEAGKSTQQWLLQQDFNRPQFNELREIENNSSNSNQAIRMDYHDESIVDGSTASDESFCTCFNCLETSSSYSTTKYCDSNPVSSNSENGSQLMDQTLTDYRGNIVHRTFFGDDSVLESNKESLNSNYWLPEQEHQAANHNNAIPFEEPGHYGGLENNSRSHGNAFVSGMVDSPAIMTWQGGCHRQAFYSLNQPLFPLDPQLPWGGMNEPNLNELGKHSELGDDDDDDNDSDSGDLGQRGDSLSQSSYLSGRSKRLSRSLIKPTQITVETLLAVMPVVIHHFPITSRIGLCRQLKGKLYADSPQPSPNFIINTLIPVFLAAGMLGFPWHLHASNSLAFVKSWIFNHPHGRELLNRVRIDYHAPTSSASAHSVGSWYENLKRYHDNDDYYSYCINRELTLPAAAAPQQNFHSGHYSMHHHQ